MLTGVIDSLKCGRCTKRLHVSNHFNVKISDETLEAKCFCGHVVRFVKCDPPEGSATGRETTCPQCEKQMLLAGMGFVDREGFDIGFVCQRCNLTIRRRGGSFPENKNG